MNTDPARIPVIIGVGQINDRENVHDALGLMVAALEAADRDAGGGWISQRKQALTQGATFCIKGEHHGRSPRRHHHH